MVKEALIFGTLNILIKWVQLPELRSHGDTLFVAPLEPAGRLSRWHVIENDIIQMYVM